MTPARVSGARPRSRRGTVDAVAVHLLAADPTFGAVLAAAGPFQPRPPIEDAFSALARAICFQQLAGKAATAIHSRFRELFGGMPPAPEAVLAMGPEALRSAGLSGAKTAAILDLAVKCTDGTVPLDELAAEPDEEVIERLSLVRGIGRWTAEMFLLFELRRPDVWPVDDYGVRKGWALIHGLDTLPTPKDLRLLGEPLRPHRSAAAWYCWRAADTVVP